MKHIVLSGINVVDGGALTIYKQALEELRKLGYTKKNNITIFVHSRNTKIQKKMVI